MPARRAWASSGDWTASSIWRLGEPPRLLDVRGAPAGAGEGIGLERGQGQHLRRLAREEHEGGPGGPARLDEHPEDRPQSLLDRGLPRVLGRELEGALHLVETDAQEVARLAQLADREAELGGGLRVGLGERLRRAGVRADGPASARVVGGRHADLQVLHGLGRLGGRILRRRRRLRAAEHPLHRLLRPGLHGLPRRQLQRRVAPAEVLDREGQDGGEGLEHPLARSTPPPGTRGRADR